jgi:hypothetical protein
MLERRHDRLVLDADLAIGRDELGLVDEAAVGAPHRPAADQDVDVMDARQLDVEADAGFGDVGHGGQCRRQV